MTTRRKGASGMLGMRAYARHRGVSLAAVQRAIREGRINSSVHVDARGRKMIDPGAADSEWDEKTGEKRGELPKDADSEKAKGLAAARLRREVANAKLAELKLEQELGNSVSASEVRKSIYSLGRHIRDSMLSIPDRLVDEVAAETDKHRIRIRMVEEIETALRALTKELSKVADDGDGGDSGSGDTG